MQPTLDILVVNWNAGSQLNTCLKSIAAADRRGYSLESVLVVDNASTDGSADTLSFPSLPLRLIRNDENRGFGSAINQGAAHTDGDLVLILNPDIRLEKDTLAQLTAFISNSDQIKTGIASVRLLDEKGEVNRSCARFPTPGQLFAQMLGLDRLFPRTFPGLFLTEWPHDSTRQVDQVPGGFFMIRREAFEQIGGFDEQFFMYFEDVDISLRAKQAGWHTMFFAEAQAVHPGRGTTDQIKARRLFYFLRSRVLYVRKHFGRSAALGVLFGTLFIEPFPRLLFGALQNGALSLGENLRGYGMLTRAVPELLRESLK